MKTRGSLKAAIGCAEIAATQYSRNINWGNVEHSWHSSLMTSSLRATWGEVLKQLPIIEVVGQPVRLKSSDLRAYRAMLVRVPARS